MPSLKAVRDDPPHTHPHPSLSFLGLLKPQPLVRGRPLQHSAPWGEVPLPAGQGRWAGFAPCSPPKPAAQTKDIPESRPRQTGFPLSRHRVFGFPPPAGSPPSLPRSESAVATVALPFGTTRQPAWGQAIRLRGWGRIWRGALACFGGVQRRRRRRLGREAGPAMAPQPSQAAELRLG